MMSQNFLARVFRFPPSKSAETLSYEELFAGEESAPRAAVASQGNYMPGLRLVENDVEAYFKHVFAGPVF